MAQELLLDSHIQSGMIFLEELDKKLDFQITSAIWFYDSDSEKWKLLLYSPQFDVHEVDDARKMYADILTVFFNLESQVGNLSFQAIKLVFKNDPLAKIFKSIVHAEGMNTIRMKSNYFDGIYIEDALIYRNI